MNNYVIMMVHEYIKKWPVLKSRNNKIKLNFKIKNRPF